MEKETFDLSIYKRKSPVVEDLHSLRRELRERRKRFLGSYISLRSILCCENEISEERVTAMAEYLSTLTAHFWEKSHIEAKQCCFHFYEIALSLVASGEVGNECIDDIIQLAECMVRSRSTFMIVCKKLLKEEMMSSLFEFVDTYSEDIFDVTFEDAVLAAVSVFLGVLPKPNIKETEE